MKRALVFALTGLIALITAAESAPRRRPSSPRPEPKQVVQDQDEYRSCDVAVRDFVQGRKEATALPVKEVKADSLRMTLNFVHPYGESGDTPPNLGFTRGETIEDRRRALNEAKNRVRVLIEAARTGNVWYVIALNKDTAEGPDAKRTAAGVQQAGRQPSASAAVLANIENRCINVYQFEAIALDAVPPELRIMLGEQGASPKAAEDSEKPPS